VKLRGTHWNDRKWKRMAEDLILTGRVNSDGSPVVVEVWLDEKARKAYQIDVRNGLYREADASVVSDYGPWQKLEL
jgi:hypothetical protein